MNPTSKLHHKILGIEHGNFSPTLQTKEQFLAQMEKAKKLLGNWVSKIFAPRVNFTNQLAVFGENDDILTPWFLRTKSSADAGMINGPGIAIAFFNADCPILCLHQDEKLVVAHLGYRCIIRENPAEEGIIETCLKNFDPAKVNAFIFGGIGPCCWIPENDKPEIQNPDLCRHPKELASSLKKTTRSPLGKNLVSVDLYKLAKLLLLKCGVSPEKISHKPICTCCSSVQKNSEPTYWSHTRFLAEQQAGQKPIDGRNFTASWLE